jgi:hypothetical protein
MPKTHADVGAELIAKGALAADVEAAFELGQYISNADRIAFSDSPLSIHMSATVNHFDSTSIAACRIDSTGYEIYCLDLRKNLMQLGSDVAPFITKEGVFISAQVGKEIDIFQGMAIIAVHEVRHRIQQTNASLKFFGRDSRTKDLILATMIEFVRINFDTEISKWLAEGISADMIDYRTNAHEFDAHVIQNYFNNLRPKTQEEVREILFLEAL